MSDQKSQIRINTSTDSVKVVPILLIGIVVVLHVVIVGWFWAYKPRATQADKMLELMQFEVAPPKTVESIPASAPSSTSSERMQKRRPVPQANIVSKPKVPEVQEHSGRAQVRPASDSAATNETPSLQNTLPSSTPDAPTLVNVSPETNSDVLDLATPAVSAQTSSAQTATTLSASNQMNIDFGLLGSKRKLPSSRMNYDAFLNGAKVAHANYQLGFSGDDLSDFEASFRLRATGVTAWIWRGERIELSRGKFSTSGFNPDRLTQIQGERPARERDVKRDATDSVSSIFQLMSLGISFPDVLVPGFSRTWDMQKTSRVDRVRVKIGEPELLQFNGQQVSALPVSLNDEFIAQKSADVRTIWFVPSLQWLPIRIIYSDGKYDVELRMVGMPAPAVKPAESP